MLHWMGERIKSKMAERKKIQKKKLANVRKKIERIYYIWICKMIRRIEASKRCLLKLNVSEWEGGSDKRNSKVKIAGGPKEKVKEKRTKTVIEGRGSRVK